MTIGAAEGITVIVPLQFGRRRKERIAAKQYSYSLAASFRQECRREGYGERSEIIARYQPRSEESFISDFWAAEARKSDTPLSRNFGRLIIISRGARASTVSVGGNNKSRRKRRSFAIS